MKPGPRPTPDEPSSQTARIQCPGSRRGGAWLPFGVLESKAVGEAWALSADDSHG